MELRVGEGLLGRIFNGLGQPIDGYKDIISSKKVNFGTELPIDEQHREVVSIANTSKSTMKFQITHQKDNYKYKVDVKPDMVILRNGEGCEFEIFVTFFCTTHMNEKIIIVSKNILRAHKEILSEFEVSGEAAISTRLDPDELFPLTT